MNEYNVQDKLNVIKVQVIKIGYPILWGILSFVLLILELKTMETNSNYCTFITRFNHCKIVCV